MLLNIKELAAKEHAVPITGQVDLSSTLNGRKDVLTFGPLQLNLRASHVGGVVEVDGTMDLELEQSCSRCLGPAKQSLHIPFRELFTQQPDTIDGDESEDMHLVTEDKVDLLPYVVENVLVELPYVPLCKSDCPGLCPTCGHDRNEGECGCKEDNIDPRLAGLADFFKQ
ncbi:YceD family protein [Paenibacillus sp. KN14-4R]|uniref:YceD family protein n=1 Tax=Paenibacillus sp. KN14-4R TaxID=3445773 RepID=UPI003FA0B678